MGTERRRQLVLAALAVVLAIVAYRQWPGTAPVATPPSNQKAAVTSKAAGTSGVTRGRSGKPPAPAETTDVHLEALTAERPKPGPTERNLFRFREKPPPSPPTSGRGDTPTQLVVPNPAPAGPPQPPPLPPINLKCLGIVSKGAGKIAVITDGNGPPVSGSEGQVVLGRYRILKIGEESIEVAYSDGRGRQTIRVTGS